MDNGVATQAHGNGPLTLISMIVAAITGWKGLTMEDVDLALAIILKLLSIASMCLVIAINWKGGIDVIKSVFKKIQK